MFSESFEVFYGNNFTKIHSHKKNISIKIVNEFTVHGYGIADIISMSHDLEFEQNNKPTIRAFELKISNWRKAISQAYRYKYYANASIVVLPAKKVKIPLKYIETFRKLNIGLWAFDDEKLSLKRYFTPRPVKPFAESKYNYAIEALLNIN